MQMNMMMDQIKNQNEVTQLLRPIEAAFSLLCNLHDHKCQDQ